MKRKALFFVLMLALFVCALALSASAAPTNEFGTVEPSDTIDLTGMATDTDVRVVLFDGSEYHTYPAQYIVTSATDFTLDFGKINAAFTKSYDKKSIIRIEIPSHVVRINTTSYFAYGNNNNLKEVIFTEDTQCTTLGWGAFESNTGLERIVLPKTLTTVGNNLFCKCSALKEVVFPEDSVIEEIAGDKFVSQCKSLEKIVFPNSLKKINTTAFDVCTKLKVIVFGANFESIKGAWSDMASGATYYIPVSFFGEGVTEEPPSNLFHWAGASGNGVDGNTNNPQNLTFVFTGTKEQAMALQARFKAADDSRGYVGLKRLWNATLCTPEEYYELTGSEVGQGTMKGNFLVYGYSACDAFYNGVHTLDEEKSNSCAGICANCALVTPRDNPVHNTTTTLAYANGFNTSGTKTVCCSNDGCPLKAEAEVSSIDAIFTGFVYSTREENGSRYGIVLSYGVNQEALEAYQTNTNKTVSYGVVAIAEQGVSGNPLENDGTPKVESIIATDVTGTPSVDLIIWGSKAAWEAELEDGTLVADLDFYILGYAIEENVLDYFYGEASSADITALTAISYNDIKALA